MPPSSAALEARDQTLQALVQQVSRAAESAAAADVPVDATELRSLRNAVATLTKERAGGVNAAQVQSLVTAMRALDERVGALATQPRPRRSRRRIPPRPLGSMYLQRSWRP